MIGEISDGWCSGAQRNQTKQNEEIITAIHEWFYNEGGEEMQKLRDDNPSSFFEAHQESLRFRKKKKDEIEKDNDLHSSFSLLKKKMYACSRCTITRDFVDLLSTILHFVTKKLIKTMINEVMVSSFLSLFLIKLTYTQEIEEKAVSNNETNAQLIEQLSLSEQVCLYTDFFLLLFILIILYFRNYNK